MEYKVEECYGFFKYIIFIIIYGTLFILLFIQTFQIFSISLLLLFQIFYILYLTSDIYYSTIRDVIGSAFLIASFALSLLGILYLITGIIIFNQNHNTFNISSGDPSLQSNFNMFKYIYISHFSVQLICSIIYFTQTPGKPFIYFNRGTEFHVLLKVLFNLAMIILALFTVYYGIKFVENAKTA